MVRFSIRNHHWKAEKLYFLAKFVYPWLWPSGVLVLHKRAHSLHSQFFMTNFGCHAAVYCWEQEDIVSRHDIQCCYFRDSSVTNENFLFHLSTDSTISWPKMFGIGHKGVYIWTQGISQNFTWVKSFFLTKITRLFLGPEKRSVFATKITQRFQFAFFLVIIFIETSKKT